ncbi:MAG TPA: hypothetical protein DD381_03395 [Lentisphaeria bacterium]|nr:MAG: hypothetical protein A2X47_02855 [Lentisphaerae bacterium GWF2_38_69]HBM15377.1 hypothetical protein [Lentisphaeria bacterium]
MKIALVELTSRDLLNIYSVITMPRGIPLLAAIIKDLGHKVDCFVDNIQKFNWKELLNYDLIGFSIISCTANPTYNMIKKLKNAKYKGKIVTGGPHATALPNESLNTGADIVVRQEGDKTFPQLIHALEQHLSLNNVLGISWKTETDTLKHNPNQKQLTSIELSNLPPPAFDTIRGYKNIRQIPLVFSRGCPYDCIFCAVRSIFGTYRFSTVASRISQLKTFKNAYPWFWKNCMFFFADDNFFGDRESLPIAKEMLKQMIAGDLIPKKGWVCQMRVTDANIETAQLLKEAGCKVVCLGIETTDAVALKSIQKGQTPDDIRNGLSHLHTQKIKTLAMTITGIGTETFWSFFKGIRTLRQWGITYIQILAMVPFPGTKMTNQLESMQVKFSHNYDLYNGMHVLIKPAKMSVPATWMSVYLTTIWFYFFTVHGLKLFITEFRHYLKMLTLLFLQGITWPIRLVKECFIYR